jgi:hypothetical protein
MRPSGRRIWCWWAPDEGPRPIGGLALPEPVARPGAAKRPIVPSISSTVPFTDPLDLWAIQHGQ